MSTNVLITPGSGTIQFTDSSGTPGTVSITGSTPNQMQFGGTVFGGGSTSLVTINDSPSATLVPGTSGYELGSGSLAWRLWATSGDFNSNVTLASAASLLLGNTGGANGPPLQFTASSSAPSSLSAGQMWWDGTSLRFYTSATKVFAWTDFSNISGTLTVPNGGTGVGTFTANGVLYGNTTSAIQVTAASAAVGAILQTTTSGSAPSWATTLPGAYTLSGSSTPLTVSVGQVAISATGSTGGLLLGGDLALYRGASAELYVVGNATVGTATASNSLPTALSKRLSIINTTGIVGLQLAVVDGTLNPRAEFFIDGATALYGFDSTFTNTNVPQFVIRSLGVEKMRMSSGGLLTVANGVTITAGTFTIGSFTFAVSSNSTLSTNGQSLIVNASIGNFTIGAGAGTSATQHNFVQSGTTQYVLESATAPTALGDMYYASTASYATMTKLSVGVRGGMLVLSGATPTPTWIAPSATAGLAMVSAGTGADLVYGTVVVPGGGTGATTFTANGVLYGNTTSAIQVTAASGAIGAILQTTTSGGVPSYATTLPGAYTLSNTGNALIVSSSTAKVGIGIASPASALHVANGNILVDPNNLAVGTALFAMYSAGGSHNYGSWRNNNQINVLPTGRIMSRNPDLLDGLTGYATYDNGASGTVSIAIITDATSPAPSGTSIQISYTGASGATPGIGGIRISITGSNTAVNSYQYRAGNRMLWVIRANIPVGYTLNAGANSLGTGGTSSWLTPNTGTGDWAEYVFEQSAFNDASGAQGYLFLTGALAAISWTLGAWYMVDVDNSVSTRTTPDLNIGYYMGANLNYGDLLNTGNGYFATTPSKNIGLGTTSPGQKLDIGYGHLRFTPLAAPGAPTVATGSAGVLTGNYYYMVTFVTVSGETSAGAASAVVTPSSKQVSLTAIPTDTTGNATSRKIYRTLTGGVNTGPFFLVTTIADNTTTTYTDNIADGSLTGTDATNQPNTTSGRIYLGTIKAGFLGTFSTAFGYNSLPAQTTGFSNAAYGNQALASLTSGNTNVAIGPLSLNTLVSGGSNTAVGYDSGQNATGSNGSYFGFNAGRGVLGGGGNTMLGFQAGYSPNGTIGNATTTGQNNTFVGYASGPATSSQINNSIAIGINSIVTGSNQANIGGIGSTYAVNVGLANSNPAQRLDIGYGHLRFTQLAAPTALTTATGSAGVLTGNYYYMVTFVTGAGETNAGTVSAVVAPSSQQVNLTAIPTDALGFATSRKIYRTATGGVTTGPFFLLTTIADNTTTTYTDNTADGSLGTTDFTNRENTTAGLIYINSQISGIIGTFNVVIGKSSFYTNNTSGTLNVGLGPSVLNANTTGIRNTAIGNSALSTNTTGSHNTAVGHGAGNLNTTGQNNTSVGEKANWQGTTGQNNSAYGIVAIQGNYSGSQHTAVGTSALQSTTFQNDHTAIGTSADILVPGTFSAAATSGAGMGTGVYLYAVTFLINGFETACNTIALTQVSVTTTGGNNRVNLTGIPTYTGSYSAQRKIYRTAVGGTLASTFSLVATIADNTTTTYTDSTADGSLGSAMLTTGQSIMIGRSAQALYQRQLVIGSTNGIITDGFIGNGVYASTPQQITLHSTGGLGTNIAGANFVIAPGQGTGTGAGGYFSVQTAAAGSSSAIFNALTERFRIDSTGLTSVKGTFNAGSSAQMTIDASGNIGTSGGYTQTGSTANTLSGATTFSAASTALTVNNNSTFSGLVGIGGASVSAKQLNVATTAVGNVGIYVNAITSQTANLQNWAVNGTILASINASGNLTATTTMTINNTVGGYSVSFTTANAFNATQVYTLPSNYPGTNGLILACTTSGQLSWVSNTGSSSSATIGGAVTGGNDGYVLYINNPGSTPVLAQDSGFVYDYGNQTLLLEGTASGQPTLKAIKSSITTTSTPGIQIVNNTVSTSGVPQQQSPGLDLIGHAWNTTTPADNYVRYRTELQVTNGASPFGTLLWESSIDTGTASFTNQMSLTSDGLLTVANGLTITSGAFTIGSYTFSISSNSILSTNGQNLIMNASIGDITFGSGVGSSSTQHNFVQSGTTQYILESTVAPTALGDMYYASTTSYATMTKLSIGVQGSVLVANGATPTPTWLAPSATAGIAVISGGGGVDLTYGTVLVVGGGTGQTSFASTNSLLVSGSSSTGAFTTVTGAAGLLYGTAANTAPTFVTSIGTAITFTAGLTVGSGLTVSSGGLIVSASGITNTLNGLGTTSTLGDALQNTTAATSGVPQQQSPAFDYIGHVWNSTSVTDNYARIRTELRVINGPTPSSLYAWRSSIDTGTASFSDLMTLSSSATLTVAGTVAAQKVTIKNVDAISLMIAFSIVLG